MVALADSADSPEGRNVMRLTRIAAAQVIAGMGLATALVIAPSAAADNNSPDPATHYGVENQGGACPDLASSMGSSRSRGTFTGRAAGAASAGTTCDARPRSTATCARGRFSIGQSAARWDPSELRARRPSGVTFLVFETAEGSRSLSNRRSHRSLDARAGLL